MRFQIRAGQGFLLVFAVNNRKSFEKLDDYREAILNIKVCGLLLVALYFAASLS